MPQAEKITNEIFARNLRAHMEAFGATQQMLSQDLGIAQSAISNYLNGRVPRLNILVKLAGFFGVSTEDLIGKDITHGVNREKTILVEAATWFDELKEHLDEAETRLKDAKKVVARIEGMVRAGASRKK